MACVATAFISLQSWAIDPSTINLKVKCDPVVTSGSSFDVEYSLDIDENVPENEIFLSLMPVDGDVATIQYQNKVCSSVSHSLITRNGKTSTSTTLIWKPVFRALKPGKVTLPDYLLTLPDNRTVRGSSGKIVRVNDRPLESPAVDNLTAESDAKTDSAEETIIKFIPEISRKEVQLGDTLTFKVQLRTNTPYLSYLFIDTPIEVDDCRYELMTDIPEMSVYEETDGDSLYSVYLYTYKVTPLRRGILSTPGMTLTGKAEVNNPGVFSDPLTKTIRFEEPLAPITFNVK